MNNNSMLVEQSDPRMSAAIEELRERIPKHHLDKMTPEELEAVAAEYVRQKRAKYPATSTAAELRDKIFAPVRWAVPGILPEGVTIFAGKAKMGKSWLALGLCIAVALGGYALGKKPVERGHSLYLALEDNERRMHNRLRTVLAGAKWPDGFHYSTSWPKIGDGGAEASDEWLCDHPGTRLVVIDTLKKIRPKAFGNRNIYDVDYEAFEPLLPIAAKYNVAILVVHHTNKMADPSDPFDVISGSTGLTGGVDNVLILNRARGNADAFLYVDGRDIEEQGELPLKWDQTLASWTLQAGETITYRMGEERQKIYDVLPDHGAEGIGPRAIAEATGMREDNVRYLLGQMVDSSPPQAIKSGYGKYTKPPHTPHSPHTPHGPHTSTNGRGVSDVDGTPHTSGREISIGKGSVSGVRTMRGDGGEDPHTSTDGLFDESDWLAGVV
jgi:AAA domain-containing protein